MRFNNHIFRFLLALAVALFCFYFFWGGGKPQHVDIWRDGHKYIQTHSWYSRSDSLTHAGDCPAKHN